MTNSAIDQTEAYYSKIEEDRKNGTAPKANTSGPFFKLMAWVIAAAVTVSLGLFCISTLVEKQRDDLGGSYVTDCKDGDKYSGKVPASYDGDIFSYKNDDPNSNVTVMAGGCLLGGSQGNS